MTRILGLLLLASLVGTKAFSYLSPRHSNIPVLFGTKSFSYLAPRHSNIAVLFAQSQRERRFSLHQQQKSDEDQENSHGPMHALAQTLGKYINHQQKLVDKLLGRSSDSRSGSVAATESPLRTIAQGVHELNQKIAPVVDALNEKTAGFAFRYADTSPYNETTMIGILFLLTNGLYFLAGNSLRDNGEIVQSVLLDSAGIVSTWYHWSQLHFGPNRDEVRVALLADYFFAFLAINGTVIEIVIWGNRLFGLAGSHPEGVSFACIVYGVVGVSSLLGSWVYDRGLPYIALHGTWHVFSALCAAEIGMQLHLLSVV